MHVVAYISAHGLGHVSRVVEVLNALRALRPDVRLTLRTRAPRWFFEFNLHGAFALTPVALDVGAIQPDSLSIDAAATLRAATDLWARAPEIVAAERAALAPHAPSMILADIPALALDVAAALGIPGIALANFSWDWIYADYVGEHPAFGPIVDDLRASYGRTTLLLRLPLHGDLTAFPRIRDIPFVARRATLERADVRSRLGLPATAPLVLLSFGGMGARLPAAPSAPRDAVFLTSRPLFPGVTTPWCREIGLERLRAAGVRYEDLVAAVDVVVTKPGYGIVAECIANGTPIVYTPRGRFAEYDCLLRGIQTHLPHALLSTDDLHAGRWKDPLAVTLGAARALPAVDTDGARIAAAALVDAMDGA